MEKMGVLIQKRDRTSSLERLQTELQEDRRSEITVYSDNIAEPATVAKEVVKLKHAFPTISSEFADILCERIIANNFTEQRVRDAVSYVLDNFKYQKPSVADVVSFDKKLKIFNYTQMLEKLNEIGASVWNDYKPVILPGCKKTVYIDISEAEAYGMNYELVGQKA